ncbi:MAG: hypothetical protein ACOY46_06520 [Bacillota bacterium]
MPVVELLKKTKSNTFSKALDIGAVCIIRGQGLGNKTKLSQEISVPLPQPATGFPI